MTKQKPLVLWGGVDVSPDLYDKYRHSKTQHPNNVRDQFEIDTFEAAYIDDKPIIGVCRGAQLLCILNSGSLYQHSTGHNESHDIVTKDNHLFRSVSADHHQIMIPKGDYELLAWDTRPTKVWTSEDNTETIVLTPEVIWYPKTRSLCIQPHPEWELRSSRFLVWINKVISDFDIDYQF